METNYIICYNLCTEFGDVKMNKNLFLECKDKIEIKINEILDKEMEKYSDNEFIKESIGELKRLSSSRKRYDSYL